MRRWQVNSEGGFAVASVVAMLLVVGIIIGAVLQLAAVSTRAALREQQSVQALANAESGVDHALAWLSSDDFDPDLLSDPNGYVIASHLVLGAGGYRDVTIKHRDNFDYVINAIGYQTRPTGGEVTRQVQVAIQLMNTGAGPMFPRHWLALDPPDPFEEGSAYEAIDLNVPSMPAWKAPDFGSQTCTNWNQTSRDIVNERCLWSGHYTLDNKSVALATIDNARVTIDGNMKIEKGSKLYAQHSVISVKDSLSFGNDSPAEFEDVTFYVGKNIAFNDNKSKQTFQGSTTFYSGDSLSIEKGDLQFNGGTNLYVRGDMTIGNNAEIKFLGETIVYVDGDLYMEGSLEFGDGATFYVNGNVYIAGNGWKSSAKNENSPWIAFHVRKGLDIGGNGHSGASIPDSVFLLDTDPKHSDYPVILRGNSTALFGGIYAPTRKIELDGPRNIWGSLIGEQLEVNPKALDEEPFKGRYEAHKTRMESFTLASISGGQRFLRLAEWRELR